jgi:integrase
MRVVLKGIDSSRSRLADGSVRVYYYTWRGGPRLDGEPGSPEFVASYNRAVADRPKPVRGKGTVEVLVDAYLDSQEFLNLRDRTRSDYRKLTKAIVKTILTTQAGLPWTPDGFRASWGKASVKAGVRDLTFNDLRGTAVLRLALSGCTVPEIATITGHSIRDVQSILDSNYLHRDVELAESAVRKLEARFGNRSQPTET